MRANHKQRRARIGAARVASAAAALLIVLTPVRGGAAEAATPTPGRRVLWRLPSGETKAYLFRGSVAGGAVTGTLHDGEVAVTVEGTVAPDGALTGVLKRADGSVAGTFARPAPETTGPTPTAAVLESGKASEPAPVDPALGGGTWWVTDDMHALTP